MGLIKGQTDYQRWKIGERLTRQEAIEANCYECNGGEAVYCGGEKSCALYAYSPYNREALKKRDENKQNTLSRQISATQTA